MARTHTYELGLRWTGNRGTGTATFRGYARDHELSVPGKPTVPGSSDPAFRGDATRWNPEELLVAALAQCHLLWYLHLAADAGVTVVAYEDAPTGTMAEDDDGRGGGAFTEVVLHPAVTVDGGSDPDVAQRLHDDVDALCFIARSVNFPVRHEPTVRVAAT